MHLSWSEYLVNAQQGSQAGSCLTVLYCGNGVVDTYNYYIIIITFS